jgi:hypothetical protein
MVDNTGDRVKNPRGNWVQAASNGLPGPACAIGRVKALGYNGTEKKRLI